MTHWRCSANPGAVLEAWRAEICKQKHCDRIEEDHDTHRDAR